MCSLEGAAEVAQTTGEVETPPSTTITTNTAANLQSTAILWGLVDHAHPFKGEGWLHLALRE